MSDLSDIHFDSFSIGICQRLRLSLNAKRLLSFMAFMMVPRETPARSAACCGVSLVTVMTLTISDNFLIGMTLLQSPYLLAEVGKQLFDIGRIAGYPPIC